MLLFESIDFDIPEQIAILRSQSVFLLQHVWDMKISYESRPKLLSRSLSWLITSYHFKSVAKSTSRVQLILCNKFEQDDLFQQFIVTLLSVPKL